MAQGTIKTKPLKTTKPSHSTKGGVTKKGARTIAPKKANLVKQQKMAKKLSAGLNAKTEQMLGERVGHLELLEAGKKRNGGQSKEDKQQKRKGS